MELAGQVVSADLDVGVKLKGKLPGQARSLGNGRHRVVVGDAKTGKTGFASHFKETPGGMVGVAGVIRVNV